MVEAGDQDLAGMGEVRQPIRAQMMADDWNPALTVAAGQRPARGENPVRMTAGGRGLAVQANHSSRVRMVVAEDLDLAQTAGEIQNPAVVSVGQNRAQMAVEQEQEALQKLEQDLESVQDVTRLVGHGWDRAVVYMAVSQVDLRVDDCWPE
jgi:hypothetical protein